MLKYRKEKHKAVDLCIKQMIPPRNESNLGKQNIVSTQVRSGISAVTKSFNVLSRMARR